MEFEKDNKVNKIQNTIMNSLANIYQKAEEIEKVDKENADWIVKRIEEVRKDIENNNTQPIEFLSEIMLIQTEIMNLLDTDEYKKKTIEIQENPIEKELNSIKEQTISEEDKAALLQNDSKKTETNKDVEEKELITDMQIYKPHKKHLWKIILDKILNLFGRKQEAC